MESMADHTHQYLFNHLFLPTRVPKANDLGNGSGDQALAQLLAQSAKIFRDQGDIQYYQQWSTIYRTLRNFIILHRHDNTLSKDALQSAFQDIRDGGVLILHIAIQNSGLLIRKSAEKYFIESFEASPPAATVLSSQKALQWDFPSHSVVITAPAFEDPFFQASLTEFLERASVEPVKQFAATSLKAGSLAYESRDTTTPAIIGQLLMSILEANGHKHTPLLTQKRVRDEVCWGDGAENPWRRSPTWLVLRVGLQRSLCAFLGGRIGILHYKFFMCFVISSLCQEFGAATTHNADRLISARTKLTRRLAKLQRQRGMGPTQVTEMIDLMFSKYEKAFRSSVELVNDRLQRIWRMIQVRANKRVLALPRRADHDSTVLSLSYSRDFLLNISDQFLYGRLPVTLQLERRQRNIANYSDPMQAKDTLSTTHYLHLADFEADLKRDVARNTEHEDRDDPSEVCVDLKCKLERYQRDALPAYRDDPEQASLMLLIIIELWEVLDSLAIALYPLLAKYDPGFPRDILFSLQLSEAEDMRRLKKVEEYIDNRRNSSDLSLPSVFGHITGSSFAVQYFDQCYDMQDLLTTIEDADEAARERKEIEWRHKSLEYEELVREAAATACLPKEDVLDPLKRECDPRCRKHYLERVAKRMRIQVHEAILPDERIIAKAVIFELLLPEGFVAWRDTTWQIHKLARGDTISDQVPPVLLQDYPSLRAYSKPNLCNVTLASRTKPFKDTHYKQVTFPTSLDQVCHPHGLKYGLFDREKGIWTSRHSNAMSFADLCSPRLPSRSVYGSLRKYLHPNFEGAAVHGNEVVASQTRCPNTLTVAEFTSFQDLRLGNGIQWLRLLRELASPNLNFGTIEVGALVAELALMAGPSEGRSYLRANHWIFQKPEFCAALIAQINQRLVSIAANWREGQTVECMLILLQRIWSLATSSDSRREAEILVLSVRKMTHGWIRHLRDEICNAADLETAQKRSKDALLAAILSRKTFVIETTRPSDIIQSDALACFLECGFTLKDNSPKNEAVRVAKTSTHMRRLLVNDLKLVHRLENKLRCSIDVFPEAVNNAVNSVWVEADGYPARPYSRWSFLSPPYSGWMTAKSLEQSVHVDLLEGTLLINGRPLGRLPEEYTKLEMFQQLFGTRVFLTYPSPLPGMSYRFASLFHSHEIHFGFRGGVPFIRARIGGKILELVPRTIFKSNVDGDAPDLPLPLIDDCVHWLDIASRILEIRPCVSMWQIKTSNWRIDLRSNTARRRNSLLVDPRSPIFNRVATVIEPFEHRNRMIVYQPEKGSLSLQLPGLELRFEVNREGLLESKQLRAAVDFDQNAGTLYGMRSCLVLRDCTVPEERSIIVAMGPASVNSNGNHIIVQIKHTGYYARFSINKEMGRLECAAEPRLLYFKAYCHAVTSFVLPDPLTGRTGTDEAIHCLQAGSAQPWAPVDEESYRILSEIAKLTPQRLYYPENLKVLQKVIWNDNLLPEVQHDIFHPAVRDIVQQCRLLNRFHMGSNEPPSPDHVSNEHLLTRAMTRNQTYRASQHQVQNSSETDQVYIPRDSAHSIRNSNAYEIAVLLRKWSSNLAVSHDLSSALQEWPIIQGFDHDFENYLFVDLINIDLASCWGSIVKLCMRSSEASDKFKLMFMFAKIGFAQADMTIIRSLIAFAVMEDLKALQLPQSSVFHHFRSLQIPTTGFLTQLMKAYRTPYPEDERSLLSVAMNPKQKRKLEIAQLNFEARSEESCKVLATHLYSQWPCREPCINELDELPLLDSEKAFLAIKPEWERLFDNQQLSEHIRCVQKILNTCKAVEVLPALSEREGEKGYFPTSTSTDIMAALPVLLYQALIRGSFTRNDFACRYSKKVEQSTSKITVQVSAASSDLKSNNATSKFLSELKTIVSPFADSHDSVRQSYGKDLQSSIHALEKSPTILNEPILHAGSHINPAELIDMILSSRSCLENQLAIVRDILIRQDPWLNLGGLLPDITPITLMEALAKLSSKSPAFEALIQYGQSITHLQHLLRIQSAYLREDTIQLTNELNHESFKGWHAKDHVHWLLLQIDFNLLIRRDQYDVAMAMIEPRSGTNCVLQMNMGQGKSSVIIPMIVAKIANGKNLVRVVVPRPLLSQTAQLLQSRLGGLLGRTAKHVPFSRRSSTEIDSLKEYCSLHVKTLNDRGVMLTLPEHMLSFKLSGLQELSNGHLQEAAYMMKLQDWFGRKCKDVLDECDHMLAVKTQLIYPSGSQSMVDGHPSRWTVVQALLKLVKSHLTQLRRQHPRGIEVIERGAGAFPIVYLLDPNVKDSLVHILTDSIISGKDSVIPIDGCSKDELENIGRFLREATFQKTMALEVAAVFKDKRDARQRLLLLRGLLVHRILLMGLNKRWNVQYGIDPRRDPTAVPFRSKGIPSDQAEFGHPDVSIILTCLSFYYSGLTMLQFQQTLNRLLKSDEPVREFESWHQDVPSFPDSLRSWSSINVEDEAQCAELWTRLYRQISVIDFFLNHLVFPRHARTFERKLVSSGWDIASVGSSSRGHLPTPLKENVRPDKNATSNLTSGEPSSLTVGFSGTNDNKTLLPLNIVQDDLPGLSHTNAEVLTYLLQPRNRKYFPTLDNYGKRLTENAFLHKLHDHGIRMLLDAGAQIIEMDNISLARNWLLIDTEAEAAVFFGDDGRARVLYRDGKGQPLAGSPFLNNLGACLVYLDEAHTRGVDLRMPANATAALTLGIMQTKDHTVQAAMRLRQLAISQSVVFFAPLEVHQSILNLRGKTYKDHLDSRDVIIWLLEQTCCNIEQLKPLYISQGLEYCRRQISAHNNLDATSSAEQRRAYLKVLEQPEQYSLETLYAPDQKTKARPVGATTIPGIAKIIDKLEVTRKSLRNTGDMVQALTHQEVEQEREVQIEVVSHVPVHLKYFSPDYAIKNRRLPSCAMVLSFVLLILARH